MHDIDVEDKCAYNYNANNSDEETIMMPITLIKTTVMQNNNHADNNGEKSIREMTLKQKTVMSIKKGAHYKTADNYEIGLQKQN